MTWHDTCEVGRKSDILDSNSITKWIFGQFRQPKKKEIITKYHMSILVCTKIYPRPLSNDYNPCRYITTECEICHETHKIRVFYNGSSWKQVKNGHVCTTTLNRQHSLSDITTRKNKLASIDRSKYDGVNDTKDSCNIRFVEINDLHSTDDQLAKDDWAVNHIETNKNTHSVALNPKVILVVGITTNKKQRRVRFNSSVQVKTIPINRQTKYANQLHVTFTSHVEVYIIPSNNEKNTRDSYSNINKLKRDF